MSMPPPFGAKFDDGSRKSKPRGRPAERFAAPPTMSRRHFAVIIALVCIAAGLCLKLGIAASVMDRAGSPLIFNGPVRANSDNALWIAAGAEASGYLTFFGLGLLVVCAHHWIKRDPYP